MNRILGNKIDKSFEKKTYTNSSYKTSNKEFI